MTTLKLPMAALPAAIADSIAVTLRAHGLSFSPELLQELGNNTSMSLVAIDVSITEAEEPTVADRLAVGETLRSLAAAGAPNPQTAEALNRVGVWLSEGARAELAAAMGGKAA